MTIDEAIAALNAMPDDGDAEGEHSRADDILLEFVPQEIADAYNRARRRVGFWYA